MLKVKIEMNKLVYLGLSILELSKTVMYEFWYKYVETKYWYNAKLCFMVTENLIKHIKTEDVYKENVYNAEEKFDTSNYGIELPLPIGKNKKVIGLMIDVLGRKIMPQFVGQKPKSSSYLIDDGSSDNKAKGRKKCVIIRILKFEDYKNCLQNKKMILKSKQRFKSELYNVLPKELTRLH